MQHENNWISTAMQSYEMKINEENERKGRRNSSRNNEYST